MPPLHPTSREMKKTRNTEVALLMECASFERHGRVVVSGL